MNKTLPAPQDFEDLADQFSQCHALIQKLELAKPGTHRKKKVIKVELSPKETEYLLHALSQSLSWLIEATDEDNDEW